MKEESSGNEKRTPNMEHWEDEEGGYSNCMEMNDNIDSPRALDVLDLVHDTPPLFQVGYVLYLQPWNTFSLIMIIDGLVNFTCNFTLHNIITSSLQSVISFVEDYINKTRYY